MDFTKLTEYINSLEQEFDIPLGSCVITKGEDVVYRYHRGFADYEKTVPLDETHLFRYMSMTKIITAVAVMQQIEAGRIGLYDPVYKYLPEYECMRIYDDPSWFEKDTPVSPEPPADAPTHYAPRPVRIIDLYTMTAGYSCREATRSVVKLGIERNWHGSNREMIRAYAADPLLIEPGTRWKYATSLDVLAAVVETVTGEKFGEYLQNHIFGPVGAKDVTFFPNPEQKKRMAAIFQYTEEDGVTAGSSVWDKDTLGHGYFESYEMESASAGLNGPLDALSRVMQALACGGKGANGARILTPESVLRFTVPYTTGRLLEDFRNANFGPYGYGLGVRVKNEAIGRSPLGEFGWYGATGGLAFADVKNQVSLVYNHHIFWLRKSYNIIHPMLRELAYEGLGL